MNANIVDKVFPLAVGRRTELSALAIAGLNLVKSLKPTWAPVIDAAVTILTPLAAAFFAAKVSRS